MKISRAEQDVVAAFFLAQRDRADGEKFATIGEAFIDDKVVSSRRSDFKKAVTALESIHCHREVLFRSLYRLHSATTPSLVPEFPDSKGVTALADDFNRMANELKSLNEALAPSAWQEHKSKMTTFHAAYESMLELTKDQIPELRERNFGIRLLYGSVGLLAEIDQDRVLKQKGVPSWLRVLRFLESEHDRYREILKLLLDPIITSDLQWFAERLQAFRVRPHKDILESYARARCSLYPTIATGGQASYELVVDLLSAFENSTRDAELLRKNLRRFKDEHPLLYAQLEASLSKEHEAARSQSGKI